MKRQYFGYIRVSTQKQGEKGVSLSEQREAILQYAYQEGLTVVEWFEERVTAAKRGRSGFDDMLRRLRAGEAEGAIVHKIDRGARNLKDWADLGELVDAGIDFKVAAGGIDLHSRSGRLSADIQAVVAADYVRNLREETRKGIYGRLKQGIYPFAAPIGYLDNGGGKLKTPDPARAPYIRQAFELYSTGNFTLEGLAEHLGQLGLRTRGGRPVNAKRLSEMLNNPFYAGIILIRTSGERFEGKHEPLVSQETFDHVQQVLRGRSSVHQKRNDFLFRRLLRCSKCGYALIGERQKGHVYYRCHSKSCRGTSVREDVVEVSLKDRLRRLQLRPDHTELVKQHLPQGEAEWLGLEQETLDALRLQLAKERGRMERLTDALIDRLIDRETYDRRRAEILASTNSIEQKIQRMEAEYGSVRQMVQEYLELWKSLHSSYEAANAYEKRDLVLTLTSNRFVSGKNVEIELSEPFVTFETELHPTECVHRWDDPRSVAQMIVETMKRMHVTRSPVGETKLGKLG